MKVAWQTETPTESGDYWINNRDKIYLVHFKPYDKKLFFPGDPFAYHIEQPFLKGLSHWAKVEYPKGPE